jgi:ribosomal protein S18 acetylase RimI-like enzyme
MTDFSLLRLDGFCVSVACDADRADLAAFCRTNPGYDILLTGEVPDPDVWVDDFLTGLPLAAFNPGPTVKLVVREGDGGTGAAPGAGGVILAVIDVTLDMIAPGVGHVGLFQLAEDRHGSGLAHSLYRALEAWLAAQGMDVIRLGVLTTNPRAARFWARHGYRPTRQRTTVLESGRVVVTDVLVKPLRPMPAVAYLERVPRDDPASG